MSETRRNVAWTTVTDTGEKPDVEIHMAAFKEKGGLATHCSLEGGLGDLITLCCNLVEHLGKTMQENHGIVGAAVFIDCIGTAVTNSTSMEAAKLASALNNPEMLRKAADKLASMLGADALADMLTEEEVDE